MHLTTATGAAGLGAAVAQNVGNYSVQGGGDWEVGSLAYVGPLAAFTSEGNL